MKAIRFRFAAVDFGRAVCNAAAVPRRTFASQQEPEDPLNAVKPHARAGVLSAVRGDDSGFPSYLILKETSPLLRSVSQSSRRVDALRLTGTGDSVLTPAAGR